MTHPWDEFSKSLTEDVPRRESLRRIGVVLAGAVLGPVGTAWAGGKRNVRRGAPPAGKDPCQSFCRCRNTRQQDACLAACRACSGDTRRLCGSCGSYVCCGSGQTCCGSYCVDLATDVYNCGACGHTCPPPGPYEVVACAGGRCVSQCVEGAVLCDGVCTLLDRDPDNCGACGNVCPGFAPDCIQGTCGTCGGGSTNCGGYCAFLDYDPYNCGACGNYCYGAGCINGVCDFGVGGE